MTKDHANRRFLCVNVDYVACCARHFFLQHSLFDIRYSQYPNSFGPF